MDKTIKRNISFEPLPEHVFEPIYKPETISEQTPSVVSESIEKEVSILLIEIIKKNIVNNDIIVKIKLSEPEIKVINLLLEKNPTIFTNISKNISEIIKDNLLDANDIPNIILLIKDIININSKDLNKLKLTRDQVIQFIRNILFILLESNTLKVNNKELCETFIDLSIKLLETKIDVKRVIRCNFF